MPNLEIMNLNFKPIRFDIIKETFNIWINLFSTKCMIKIKSGEISPLLFISYQSATESEASVRLVLGWL